MDSSVEYTGIHFRNHPILVENSQMFAASSVLAKLKLGHGLKRKWF